jgi:hypothetical protein
MASNNNAMDDIEAAPIASLRPRLDRGDAAHQPSPLVIAAYAVLKSSDGVASLEEASLKEALDGGSSTCGGGCNDMLEVGRQEEGFLTEQQQQSQQQQQVSQKQYWIDVEILEQHDSDRLESAFSEVKESILDKLLFEDNSSCRLYGVTCKRKMSFRRHKCCCYAMLHYSSFAFWVKVMCLEFGMLQPCVFRML